MKSVAILAVTGLALAASANGALVVNDLGATAPTTTGQEDFYRPAYVTNNQAIRNRNTAGDGFVALGQIFTASSSYTLDKFAIAITSSHANPVFADTFGDGMFVSIWSYSAGSFSAAPLTTATGGTFPNAPLTGGTYLEFDLTGANEIALVSGQQYAFQVGFTTLGDGDDPSFRIFKTDGNAGAYTGGQVARFESAGFTVTDYAAIAPITSNLTDQAADMYFVTYSVPEPTSLAALSLGTMAILRRRRA